MSIVPGALFWCMAEVIQTAGIRSVDDQQLYLHSLTGLGRHVEWSVASILGQGGEGGGGIK